MKKKFMDCNRYRLLKLLRIMRISVFLLVLSLMHSYATSSYGQSSVRLNLNVKGSTLEDILEKIEKETDFSFLLSK